MLSQKKKTQLTKFTFQDIKRLTLFTFKSTLVHKLCHFWGIPTATGKVSLVIMYNRGTDKHFFSSSQDIMLWARNKTWDEKKPGEQVTFKVF